MQFLRFLFPAALEDCFHLRLLLRPSFPTFKEVRVVVSIWAQEEQFLWLGLGWQYSDGVPYTLYGHCI